MVCIETSMITDPTICGVIAGWDNYITGSLAITMFIILVLLIVFAMMFRLNTIVMWILLVPFAILTLAYVGSGVGGIIIFGIVILFALFFYWVFKR